MADMWWSHLFSGLNILKYVVFGTLLLIFIEIMIAAFFQRWILSVGVLFLSLWPIFGTEESTLISPKLMISWLVSCAVLAVFPLLPVIGSESSFAFV